MKGYDLPFSVLNGQPGYINLLDALGAWQLVKELKSATGIASAASFKHLSPAGAAIAKPLDDTYCRSQFRTNTQLSSVATAYVRARGGDRMCSFGDAAAVSDPVDLSLAQVLQGEVSDLIIAPAYDPEALRILKRKKRGNYLILQMDPEYEPPALERRELYGFEFVQERNTAAITPQTFGSGVDLSEAEVENLLVATIALKYTQSNSVAVAYDGQVIGMGAGQQSRIHCTRLACDKADKWLLQQHPKVLQLPFVSRLSKPERTNVIDQFLLWEQLSAAEQQDMQSSLKVAAEPLTRDERDEWIGSFRHLCMSSDAYFPFRDSLDRAAKSNIVTVAHQGGSVRDEPVAAAAKEQAIKLIETQLRCFLH
jgi:AICAR transformylase/IMP cyclohydrolase PurH